MKLGRSLVRTQQDRRALVHLLVWLRQQGARPFEYRVPVVFSRLGRLRVLGCVAQQAEAA